MSNETRKNCPHYQNKIPCCDARVCDITLKIGYNTQSIKSIALRARHTSELQSEIDNIFARKHILHLVTNAQQH